MAHVCPSPVVEENDKPCDLSILDTKLFNNNAKWICPAIRCYPAGWTTTYGITVEADCPKTANIKISASGYFMIFDQNGNTVGLGFPYPK